MKRFLITVEAYFCGSEEIYRAEAEKEEDLEEIASQLAYDNYLNYGLDETIAEEHGYDPDEMSERDWEELWNTVDESEYYDWSIEEFTGDDLEWEEYGGEIYGKNLLLQ